MKYFKFTICLVIAIVLVAIAWGQSPPKPASQAKRQSDAKRPEPAKEASKPQEGFYYNQKPQNIEYGYLYVGRDNILRYYKTKLSKTQEQKLKLTYKCRIVLMKED